MRFNLEVHSSQSIPCEIPLVQWRFCVLVINSAGFCLVCAITYWRKIIPNLLFLLRMIVKEDSVVPHVSVNTKFPLNSVLCRTSSSLLFTICVSVVFMYLNYDSNFLFVFWMSDCNRERAICDGIMKHPFINEI